VCRCPFIVNRSLLGFVERCREICTLDWIGVKVCSPICVGDEGLDEMERDSLWFGLGLTFGYGQKQTKKKIKLKRIIKDKVFQSLIKKTIKIFVNKIKVN